MTVTDADGLAALAVEVRRVALAAGLDACGIADAQPFHQTREIMDKRKAAGLHGGMHFTYGNPERATTPTATLAGARSLVVGALSYLRSRPPAPSAPAGRVARYSWRDEYATLRGALDRAATVLRENGHRAVVLADDNALVDREAARKAGLGWYGKNANLLLPGAGSWFVLGSIVTDAALPASPAAEHPGCGTCSRCVPACPTGAIIAPGVIDARRCLAWLLQAKGPFPREYRVALGDRIYGCDDCQEVCPPNRAAERHTSAVVEGCGDEAWVPLVEIIDGDADALLQRLGRWYIPGRDTRYLRRNALVVLGNVGSGTDPAVDRALRRALADPDGLVRSHAVWAAARLGRQDLLAAVAGDPDPAVRDELALVAGP